MNGVCECFGSVADRQTQGDAAMSDADGPLMLMVRMKSTLTLDEVLAIADERAPEFAALEGLRQ